MPSDPQRVQILFLQIVELPSAERPAVLARECGSDVVLRQRIEALLKAHDESDSLLDQPSDRFGATVVSGAGDNPLAEMIDQSRPELDRSKRSGSPWTAETNIREETIAGAVIAGRYTMVQRIGEGGMGEVWVAKQTEPVKRKVALKLIKLGMDSKAVLQRFEQERQALALMDHPNIARVLDGGITPTGQPYFVMELVNGLPLNKFCDEARLTPNERLQLFIPICQAVQHAHQKGIVHRDLKPANILVTMIDGKPVPKVIDFGVAKATSGKLTDESLSTQFGAVVGTLEYMSPEQAGFSGEDIDTRADIYSLGVILYELLTGLRPIDMKRMKNAAIAEMIRIIREEEPSKPSTRLSTDESLPSMAALRQTEPKKLMALLRGELDWVVMKCLEKSRDRRYETANALSREIQRYLVDEPVEARPPSAGYRLRKFLRRHRGPVIAASLVLFSLIGGMAGTTYFAWRAVRNAASASANALSAEKNARVAQANARATSIEKERADAKAEESRRNLYIAHMNLAQSNWEGAHIGATVKLLERYAPGTTNADLCGFEWHYWDRLCHSSLRDLRGHTDAVTSVVFSPDGKRIVSASHDGSIRVWDTADGHETLTLMRDTGPMGGIAISPDGKLLASSGTFGMVTVSDAASGDFILNLVGHTGALTKSVAFSPDGKRLASANNDKTVKIWDIETGQVMFTLHGHLTGVYGVAFSPDGTRLVSAGPDVAKLWDAVDGKELLTLKTSMNIFGVVAFSPDSKHVALAANNSVKVWDATTGAETVTCNGHSGKVNSVAFSPNGKSLVSGSDDQTVRVWDAVTGEETLTLKGHTQWVSSVAFSPDGKTLASGGGDSLLKIWDATDGQNMLTLSEGGQHVGFGLAAFSPDGQSFVSVSNDDLKLRTFDVTSGQEIRALNPNTELLLSLAFSPKARLLASGSIDGIVRVWDASSAQEMLKLKGHTGGVVRVVFSPDGRRLASAGLDGTTKVWDAMSGKEMHILRGHAEGVWTVAFSPDGQRLASGGKDQKIRLWDTENGQELMTLNGHTGKINCVAFSPDAKLLVSASEDQTLEVWDANSGKKLCTLIGHTAEVNYATFSPDNRQVASAGGDRLIKIWDVESAQETLTLRGHSGPVTYVCFSSEGKRLASASADDALKVWDARPWTPELRVQQEALGLIHFLRARGQTIEELPAAILSDDTISESVRQRALQFAHEWKR